MVDVIFHAYVHHPQSVFGECNVCRTLLTLKPGSGLKVTQTLKNRWCLCIRCFFLFPEGNMRVFRGEKAGWWLQVGEDNKNDKQTFASNKLP